MFGALAITRDRDISAAISARRDRRAGQPLPMSFAAVQKHIAILERAGWLQRSASDAARSCAHNLERLRVVRHLLDDTRSCGVAASTAWLTSLPRPRSMTSDRHRVRKDPHRLTMTIEASSMRRPSGCGSCGPIRVSSSAGGPAEYPTVTQHNLALAVASSTG